MTFVRCSQCGGDDVLTYATPETAVCPNCCPDHEYEYEGQGDGWMCQYCGIYPPDDYYEESGLGINER